MTNYAQQIPIVDDEGEIRSFRVRGINARKLVMLNKVTQIRFAMAPYVEQVLLY